MLFIVFALLLMIGLLDKTLRLDRRKFILLETELKLDAIRDELLLGVLDGKQPENEAYHYLDDLIEGVSECLAMTPILWTVLILLSFVRPDIKAEEREKRQREFERVLRLPENRLLAENFTAYRKAVTVFLEKRHPLLTALGRRFKGIERRINSAEGNIPPKINANSHIFSGLRFHY